ncbi:hypothetical protein ACNKHU_26565 [Shigella flexneri]
MDPLDGSSNIDVNVSLVPSLHLPPRTPVGTPVMEEEVLQPGNEQVAAGYVVYGSSYHAGLHHGCGVHAFIYNPSLRVFLPVQEQIASRRKAKPTP